MGNSVGIVIIMLFYLVAILSSNKRKRKKQKRAATCKADRIDVQPAQSVQRSTPVRQHGSEADTAELADASTPERTLEKRFAQAREGEDLCHEQRHPSMQPNVPQKDVSQADMARAVEGEDPCHDEMKCRPENSVYDSPIYQSSTKRKAFAASILYGIVMSEVLKRPNERRREQERWHAL